MPNNDIIVNDESNRQFFAAAEAMLPPGGSFPDPRGKDAREGILEMHDLMARCVHPPGHEKHTKVISQGSLYDDNFVRGGYLFGKKMEELWMELNGEKVFTGIVQVADGNRSKYEKLNGTSTSNIVPILFFLSSLKPTIMCTLNFCIIIELLF